MRKKPFAAEEFWQRRLSENLGLQGTGHRALSLEYNRWLYRAQLDCLGLILDANRVDLTGKSVLDVGSGGGFYIDYFVRKGAGHICGVDITEVSVEYLRRTFPSATFFHADIASDELPFDRPFDLVSAISVLFHVVEDDRFERALGNICSRIAKSGHLLISDSFRKPALPASRHVRLRGLSAYEEVFRAFGMKVVQVVPMFYLLNQSFIPGIGPLILNALSVGRLFYHIDRRLRQAGRNNGAGAKLLLAQRTTG